MTFPVTPEEHRQFLLDLMHDGKEWHLTDLAAPYAKVIDRRVDVAKAIVQRILLDLETDGLVVSEHVHRFRRIDL